MEIIGLSDPNSVVTKSTLFIYSMETFIPYKLNEAEREKDASKVKTFGPFAHLLNLITFSP